MKKDNMLNESTIRRFMKLATIGGLSDKFVDEKLQESDDVEEGMRPPKRDEKDKEMREGDDDIEEGKHKDEEDLEEMRSKDKKDEEDLDEMRVKKGDDKDLDEASDEELTFEEEDLEERGLSMQMDRDDDMDAEEPAAGGMVSVDQLMSALEKALEDVLGQEVEVSQDDEEAEMDMDLDMDAPDAGDELGLDADAEEEEEEEELEEATPKTDVVEEVYARVIQRLTQETKSNKK